MKRGMGLKVWFITGSSSGFGRGLAETCLARGDLVVATARRPQSLADLATRAPDRLIAPELDVTDPHHAEQAVRQALDRFGRIDVLVNNAGYVQMGAVECVSDAETRAQFDTNVFGLLNVTRAALPAMRARRSGTIVNVSSAGGMAGEPAAGIYCASKFAVEGASEALAAELDPLGISVVIVEPGAFATNLTTAARFADAVDDYAPVLTPIRAALASGTLALADPGLVIEAILTAVETTDPPRRIMLGEDSLAAAGAKAAAIAEQIAASTTLTRSLANARGWRA
jgi:NADP-dependent 3-hydroxy acid dehydrogenase YdfG